jgi:hypothetical protein
MDPSKAGLVICITLFVVIGINAAIFVSLRHGNEVGQIELFRRAAKTARRPWQEEDDALKELSDLVSKIREEKRQEAEKIDENKKIDQSHLS